MKTIKYPGIIFLSAFLMLSFSAVPENVENESHEGEKNTEIRWMSFEEAIDLKNTNKKYFIYVYTDWCGWCTRLKNTTFQDEKVIRLLNEEFIPISFNGESKKTVNFKGQEFKYVENGPRGIHQLSMALLNNQPSYPSLVFLDEEMNMIQPLPGYKSAEDLTIILTFLSDEIYEEMTFEDYYKQQTQGG